MPPELVFQSRASFAVRPQVAVRRTVYLRSSESVSRGGTTHNLLRAGAIPRRPPAAPEAAYG